MAGVGPDSVRVPEPGRGDVLDPEEDFDLGDFRIHCRSNLKWQFDVIEDGAVVADIDLKLIREGADLDIQGETFRLVKQGLWRPRYTLEAYETAVATAQRPSVWTRRYEVEFAGKSYELTAIKWYRRTFVLRAIGSRSADRDTWPELGRVEALKWYSKSATASFPDELPLAVDVFLMALVLLAWQRTEKSS